jgi:two-component system KDP operon response regulator KdpE
MRKPRILIVDDDVAVLKFVRANLQTSDYETIVAMDGKEAMQIVEKELPDLVVLDIMMPKMDGFEVCRRIRQWSQVPIIMLSARHDLGEKVKCLNSGADDYVTKPFGVNELRARVRAVLRRCQSAGTVPVSPNFNCDDLEINFAKRRVTVSGREVKLTPTEYNLLVELALGMGKVLTHSYLLNKVWGPEYRGEREYLRVFIGRLRKELEGKGNGNHRKYIITVPGVGYQLASPN